MLIGVADQNCGSCSKLHLTYQKQNYFNEIFVLPSFGISGAFDFDGVLSLLPLDKPQLSHLGLMSVSGAVNNE